jgi:hypothetical protein
MAGHGIELKSVHLLLTYKCDGECDHCFVWSSPYAPGTMRLNQVEDIIRQAAEVDSVDSVYFEGGEPFLFYPIMLKGVEMAKANGLDAGIVSNAYWAEDVDDAELWLKPLADLGLSDLSLSTDDYHGEAESAVRVANAAEAAKRLGIAVGVLRTRRMEDLARSDSQDDEAGAVYFRGRAAVKLADKVPWVSEGTLTACPEEPPDISRVHADAYGNVLFCQGISIGNMNDVPLRVMLSQSSPDEHPIIGPLIRGGPAALAKELSVAAAERYADACHMCYDLRCRLRAQGRFAEILCPDQVYGD